MRVKQSPYLWLGACKPEQSCLCAKSLINTAGSPRRGIAGTQPRERRSPPVSHFQVPVSLWSKPLSTLAGAAHFPGVSSSAAGLSVCFGIKHINNTGPAKPARLVPAPAGENVLIGWVSGGRWYGCPGSWLQGGAPCSSLKDSGFGLTQELTLALPLVPE